MKKLLCLALVFAMVWGTALADASHAILTFSTSAGEIAKLLEKTVGNGADLLAQGVEELLNKLRLEFHQQDNAVQAGLYMADVTVFEITGISEKSGLSMVLSNLLPEHYIAYQCSDEELTRRNEAYEVAQRTDWQAAAGELTNAVQGWWNGLPVQQENGSFMGDAYTGGTLCVTRCFDDAGIAECVGSLAAVLQNFGVDNVFLQAYLGQKNLWDSVKQANRNAAEANRYAYVVKEVYSPENTLIGLSLTVLDGESQVMTASLGLDKDAWKLVLGWGLNEKNYYLCAECVEDQAQKNLTLLMYQDSQRLGFRTVEPITSYLLWLAGGTVTDSEDAGWKLDMEVVDLYATELDDFFITAEAGGKDGLTVNIALFLSDGENGAAEKPLISANFTLQDAAERTWSVEGKTRLDMEAPEALSADVEAVMEQEVSKAADAMLVELFKVFPAQLLTFLIQSPVE